MLQISVPISPEGWDDTKEEFVEPKCQTLLLEHSLVSLSKWESKWHKPFLSKKELTVDETLDYIRCMTITKNAPPDIYDYITQSNMNEVLDYISDSMTATTFKEDKSSKVNRETVTAELIYYWMTVFNIPFECEKWHLNRLLTLIRVCNVKNQPKKKRRKSDIASEYAALNAARRKQFNSKG